MRMNKLLVTLAFSMIFGSGVVLAADFNKGLEAAQSGDFKTALAEWTPLAEQGDSDAQYNVGLMYFNGWGVPENDKTAVKWLTKAAEQGYAMAQHNLGLMYKYGNGVLENDKTAVKWYTKAAEQGLADAQYNLGLMYANGWGVLTDNRRAYMWYNLGSYNGSENAGKNKDIIATQMTPGDISKAQEMSSRCLESNYTDC